MKRIYVIVLCSILIVVGEMFGSFMVDPEPPIYWTPGNQDEPAISAGENSFLAVWQDKRTDDYHIYGTLISKDGSVEPCGFLISGDSSIQVKPAVAFGYHSGYGDNYLAVWWDGNSLYGTRIRENEILDTAGISIETFQYGDHSPSIAYGGSGYIVVWDTWDGDIKGRIVDINGNVGVRFDICTETDAQYYPRVASDGTNFFVVWQDSRDGYSEIYGARVTSNGTVLDVGGIKLVNATGARGSPDVAYCGYWLCAWEDNRDGNNNIYGTRVDGNGVVVDDPSILISDASSYDEKCPAVSSDSEKFIVTYIELIEDKDIVNAIVQTDGTVLSHHSSSNSMVTYRRNMDVAFCDSVYFSLWVHGEPQRGGIVGTRIGRDGNFLDGWYGVDVGITATVQCKSDCAYGGDSALVVWKDYLLGIRGELIDLNGNPLKQLNISYTGAGNHALAFTYQYYFCVWHDTDSIIKGKRITRDGVAMPETIDIVDGISSATLDIDAGEGTFLVGWIDAGPPQNAYFSIVDTSGIILQPPTNISNVTGYPMVPALSVCFNDSNHNYLIAWEECDEPFMGYDSIFCTMVSKGGGILYQRMPVWGNPFGGLQDWNPSITYDGTNYFCVLKDGLNLLGRWINIVCEPGDTCTIPFNIYNQGVNSYSNGYFLTGEREDKIWGIRLSQEGVLVDTFEIGDGKEHSSAVMGDKYLVTWSSFTPNPYSSYRIWGEFGPLVGIEENYQLSTLDSKQKLVVYPNPFTSYSGVQVKVGAGVELKIYDIMGRLIHKFPITKSPTSIGKDIKAGIYFFEAEGYKTVKVVKLR